MLSDKPQALKIGTRDTLGLSLMISLQCFHRVGVHGMVRGKHLADVIHVYHSDVSAAAQAAVNRSIQW